MNNICIMEIKQITPKVPVCFGVGCPQHGQFQRYQAVNGATYEQRIGTCDDGDGKRPLFVPAEGA